MEETEAMYQRALDDKEKTWGPEHMSTLDTISKLDRLYAKPGKMAEAEPGQMADLEQAIQYGQQALEATPADHPDGARQWNNLNWSWISCSI